MAAKTRNKFIPATRKSPNAGPKPKVQVVEEAVHFVCRSGNEFVIDLNFPAGILRSVMTEDLDERQQFTQMLSALGDEDLLQKLDCESALDFLEIVEAFFKEFASSAGASVGESQPSAL